MTIYLIETETLDKLILAHQPKLDNPHWGCTAEQMLVRAAYEAPDNHSATKLVDLVDPVDVTSERIYKI